MQDGQNEMPGPRSNGDDAAGGSQATNGENVVTGKDRPANPKLIDIVRGKLRMLHYAKRTEEAYVGWILDFIHFSRGQAGQWVHPELLGDPEIEAYLTHLAVDRRVAASTQNQALSALLFLYIKVLDRPFRVDAVRAKRPQKLPVVLSAAEIRAVLERLPAGQVSLICRLMYGSGLRQMEAVRRSIGSRYSHVHPGGMAIRSLKLGSSLTLRRLRSPAVDG